MGFDYDILYRKGKENVVVDVLFRIIYVEFMSLCVLYINIRVIGEGKS